MALPPLISVSIVSHGQAHLVKNLLEDLEKFCPNTIQIVLTLNIPESMDNLLGRFSFPISLIENPYPKGFGENHNAAFQKTATDFFCVINPDVRLKENPFSPLIEILGNSHVGVVGPMVLDEYGNIEDSARPFMGILSFLKRILSFEKNTVATQNPDWIAGMFMLFRHNVYKEMQGFNEKYFLYCEDMDICARLKEKGYKVVYTQLTSIIHQARRKSHKNIRYFFWHIKSLLRFWYYYYFQFNVLKE